MVTSIKENQISASRIPGKEDAPLSLERAIRIACEWIGKREFRSADVSAVGSEIKNIFIESLHSEEKELRQVFYYRITFETGFFDQAACVVLMDGTVLEPEPRKRK